MIRLVWIFLLGLFLSLSFTGQTLAQALPAQASQSWKCLRGDDKGFTFNGLSSTTFSQDLYADGFPLDSNAYVVTCVGTADGGLCTTSSPEYDRIIFGTDNATTFPYSVSVEGGSKQKISLGKFHAKATITTAGLTGGLVFYAVTVGESDSLAGKGVGQKLGISPFGDNVTTKCVSVNWNTVFPPPPPPPPQDDGGGDDCFRRNGRNQCMSRDEFWAHERWDPFGIVFDSQSLEPLPNVKITVLDSNKNKYNLLGLTNPQTTLADGLFSFLVEPGTYYLSVTLPDGYTFTSSPNIHPNYISIYHKIDGSNSIYKPDEPIIEEIDTPVEIENGRPNMEHRDIPLDPGTNSPYEASPSTIAYVPVRDGWDIKINGKVSHPFTWVIFSQGTNEIKKVRSDRFGYYEAVLYRNTLTPDADINATYEKSDLKTIIEAIKIFDDDLLGSRSGRSRVEAFVRAILNPLSRSVRAQNRIRISAPTRIIARGYSFSPMPGGLEGYVYNSRDKAQPNSLVRLRLKMNNAIVYETKADQSGYIKIPQENLPVFPYSMEVVSRDGANTYDMTTSQFAKKNPKSFSERGQGQSVTTQGKQGGTPVQTNLTDAKKTRASQSSPAWVFILVIIISFGLIGLTVFYIIKNRGLNSTTTLR